MTTLAFFPAMISTIKPSMTFMHVAQLNTISSASLLPALSIVRTYSKPCLSPDLTENLRTLYLFTKSDFKTVLLPVTVFASVMAPIDHLDRLSQIVFWIWLHLLQFCVSNQTINPEEDAVNKPWRPIPSGRITLEQARTLRWILMASCLSLSLYRGVFPASLLICLSTVAYNDLRFHQHILLRNVCNAAGYAFFEFGATQLAGNRSVRSSGIVALVVSALVIFTTIHAADFRDIKGDKLEGKITIPIAFPETSRPMMLASLVLWSSILIIFWDINLYLATSLLTIGAMVGIRFMRFRDAAADRKSYLYYNIWLSIAHICLGMGQFQARTIPALRHPMMNFA